MTTNTMSAEATAILSDTRTLGDRSALADSLDASAGYLEACAEKHGATGAAARYYEKAKRTCESIAADLRNLKENSPALSRYRNALYELDDVQLEAFARIKIDYQARIGGDFAPVTTNHFLAELTAMAFALGAIVEPACLNGVGTGFAPRFKKAEAA